MFKDKVVIVTGASNGIGKAIAKAYLQEEAYVVLADIDESQGKQLLDSIEQKEKALFIKTDVRSETEIIHLVHTTKAKFGKIDILINNVGKGVFKSFYDLTIEEWDDVINTNLRSVFLCSREVAKIMRDQDSKGSIINMSSSRAYMSEPNTESYSASKGGIMAITHALANSLADAHITVNSISPGWIETKDYENLREIDHEQHLSKRVGKPEDIARACLFLTNPQNNFITGTNLMVDGGMTVKMIYEE
ncbi:MULTISPECIES: SDR family NAD(P)-dependent oxidoreductase [Niallia]|uniref:SDR family oxidoreductase n=1 Tax=Niallia alba TaxID=2729105 RepID=A0A7Y0PMB7_9BACI|nr:MULTISPECIES: glucose 1-dehydrogenase [Niallia]MDU1843996.1 SDR family oxidoreductase [Niallia nealsonii]MED3794079.1 SDR family oxidoreductase [Niallia alba]NMO77823.1 SDR family oxidoreductase [Niallia alba]UTI40988.1 SDR family oxidoreductase [Niallia sp. RD1]